MGQIFQVEDRAQEIIDAYVDGHHEVQDRVAKIEEKDRKTTFHEFHSMITSYNEIGLSNFSNYNMGQNLFEAGALDIADKFNTGVQVQVQRLILNIFWNRIRTHGLLSVVKLQILIKMEYFQDTMSQKKNYVHQQMDC